MGSSEPERGLLGLAFPPGFADKQHFYVYYTAAGPHRIHAFSNGRCDPGDTEAVIKELVPFMTRAFQAPPTKPGRKAR